MLSDGSVGWVLAVQVWDPDTHVQKPGMGEHASEDSAGGGGVETGGFPGMGQLV